MKGTYNPNSEKNQVTISGEIIGESVFSHEVFGEGFYIIHLSTSRLSDENDLIPVMVSERLVDVKQDLAGKRATIKGQLRSYNKHEEERSRLMISVFAQAIEITDESTEVTDLNAIYLDGFICKAPIYRKTPLGREITDILLAVNRPYGKSDYLPCICWGRNAKYAENLPVGSHITIHGRIQSRVYTKRISETETVERIAYEVSVNKLEIIEG